MLSWIVFEAPNEDVSDRVRHALEGLLFIVTGALVSSRDGAGGETNELSEAGKFLCLSCAHEWSAPIGAAGCTAYRHKYVQCTDYEAFARRAVSPTALIAQRHQE